MKIVLIYSLSVLFEVLLFSLCPIEHCFPVGTQQILMEFLFSDFHGRRKHKDYLGVSDVRDHFIIF